VTPPRAAAYHPQVSHGHGRRHHECRTVGESAEHVTGHGGLGDLTVTVERGVDRCPGDHFDRRPVPSPVDGGRCWGERCNLRGHRCGVRHDRPRELTVRIGNPIRAVEADLQRSGGAQPPGEHLGGEQAADPEDELRSQAFCNINRTQRSVGRGDHSRVRQPAARLGISEERPTEEVGQLDDGIAVPGLDSCSHPGHDDSASAGEGRHEARSFLVGQAPLCAPAGLWWRCGERWVHGWQVAGLTCEWFAERQIQMDWSRRHAQRPQVGVGGQGPPTAPTGLHRGTRLAVPTDGAAVEPPLVDGLGCPDALELRRAVGGDHQQRDS